MNNFGTVFKVGSTPGTFVSIFSFGGTNGAYPLGGLTEGNNGNFYGLTYGGGIWGNGTAFRMTTNDILTSLCSFTGGNGGGNPVGALVQATDGNFYGVTQNGGSLGDGTIFQLTYNGTLVTLHSFQGGNEGRKPLAGLVQGVDGNLYGTTQKGGPNDDGTVFRLVIPPSVRSLAQTENAITITWSSIVGQTYQVQCNSNLTSTNWVNLTSPIIATTSTTMMSDTISAANQQRYYRIVEYPVAW